MDIFFLGHAIIFYCPFDLTFHEIAIFRRETVKTRGRDRNYPCHSALFIAHKTSVFVPFFFSFPIYSFFSLYPFLLHITQYKCVKGGLQLSIVRMSTDFPDSFQFMIKMIPYRSYVSLTWEQPDHFFSFNLCNLFQNNGKF